MGLGATTPRITLDCNPVRGRRISRLPLTLLAIVSLAACTSSPIEFDNESLSSILSVSDITKVLTPGQDGFIVGLTITATVINTGFITVDVPFLMRWSLLRDGSTFASATQTMDPGFSPGASQVAVLVITFSPVEEMTNFQDAVTFDVLTQ